MVGRMAPLVVRQYDICRNPDRASRSHVPYFVVLQGDLLSALATVIVAPVMPKRATDVIGRLNPVVELDGRSYYVTMQEMAGIPRNRLGPAVANLAGRHPDFVAAIDLIFTGI